MSNKNIVFSGHALARSFDRGFAPNDVMGIVDRGQTIKTYPDDRPYPSRLVLGYIGNRPAHVVVAESDEQLIVVTVYQPDAAIWDDTFTVRSTT